MAWPFKKRPAVGPCFEIGQYRLDVNIHGMEGLRPLSEVEILALNPAVRFKGEQILHAPKAQFIGLDWDTILGTVDGRIYKIAIQWIGPRAEAGKANRQIVIECTRRYGNGENMAIWDTSNGNMVLHTINNANINGESVVNFFATSNNVRTFKRIN